MLHSLLLDSKGNPSKQVDGNRVISVKNLLEQSVDDGSVNLSDESWNLNLRSLLSP